MTRSASRSMPGWRLLTMMAAFPLLFTCALAKGDGEGFDHSRFDALLRSAVAHHRVDYGSFRGNASFKAYMKSLATANLNRMSTDARLAFWINAYNACVIQNVLGNPKMRKPTDVRGFFDRKKFKVAGRMLTLNNIENDVIRPGFNEPLIHFGLVCAALNCPPLVAFAYTEANVRSTLAQNARSYLASQYNRYDGASKTLSLSKIFEWYASDFGGESGTLRFVSSYGTEQMKQGIAGGGVKLRFLEYDWTINAR